MVRVKFIYRDAFSHGKWNQQEGIFRTVEECIEWYGLGKDCEYRIIGVEPEDQNQPSGSDAKEKTGA